MFRIALLVLMLTGIGPALAALPATTAATDIRVADAGARPGTGSAERLAQYGGDHRSWRGDGVRHHRSFGRGTDWRRHHRGSYDRPHWRDQGRHRDEWRHDRRRDRPWDHGRRVDRSRYDARHDRRERWDGGRGSFRGDDWGGQESHGRFDDRRRRFDVRRDRW